MSMIKKATKQAKKAGDQAKAAYGMASVRVEKAQKKVGDTIHDVANFVAPGAEMILAPLSLMGNAGKMLAKKTKKGTGQMVMIMSPGAAKKLPKATKK